jgi:hypothetical protein
VKGILTMFSISQKMPPKLVKYVRKWRVRILRLAIWLGSAWASAYHLKMSWLHAMAAEVRPEDWVLVERLGLCGPSVSNSVGAVLYHAICAGLVGFQSMLAYFWNDYAALTLLLIALHETVAHGLRAWRFMRALFPNRDRATAATVDV